jgi:HEAT repeat protein
MMNVRFGRPEKEELVRLMAGTNNLRSQYVSFAANRLGPEDTNCVPLLIDCLQNANADLRCEAAQGLGQIGPGANAAIPALTTALRDRNVRGMSFAVRVEAAHALWQIGHEPNGPMQVLEEALNDPDPQTSGWALIYLCEMRPKDDTMIPKIIAQLQGGGVFQMVAASMIGHYGAAAKDAVPDLVKLLGSANPEVRQRAIQSLKRIDPETAAKYEHK